MIKCKKCNREAEYESPDDFCKFHWHQWWVDGAGHFFVDNQEKLALEEELYQLIETNKPENAIRMEQLWTKLQRFFEEGKTG